MMTTHDPAAADLISRQIVDATFHLFLTRLGLELQNLAIELAAGDPQIERHLIARFAAALPTAASVAFAETEMRILAPTRN